MTAPCPSPPDIPAPGTVPDLPAFRMEPGTWHSAEARWPRWVKAGVLASIGLTLLVAVLGRSGPMFVETPVGTVETLPNIFIFSSPVFTVVFLLASAALAWFTRLFNQGGQALQVATAVVSIPGVLLASLYVAGQVATLVVAAGSALILAVVAAVGWLILRGRWRSFTK